MPPPPHHPLPVIRARDLLIENLTPDQVEEMELHGGITVRTPERDFHLGVWVRTYGIEDVDGPFRYCVNFPSPLFDEDTIPVPDQTLAQKLMIENDLEGFYELANVAYKAGGCVSYSGTPFEPETYLRRTRAGENGAVAEERLRLVERFRERQAAGDAA